MPNDTRADALDLGVIGLEPTVTNEQIGFRIDGKRERNDYYKITLEEESDFNLTLDRLNADANVQILDSDGSVVFQSKQKGKRREVIDANLEAGEYFVRVLPKGAAQTDYRLSLNADPIAGGSDDAVPGASLGVLSAEETVVNDEIGFTRGGQRDEDDFFNFTLDKDSDVSLTLDQLKANANVQIWDGEGETLLLQSRNTGRQGETINAILEKGDYVVQVLPQGRAKTSYRLGLSADEVLPPEQLPGAAVGDLTATEEPFFVVEDIGFGRGTQRNQRDYYSFSLGQEASFYGELDQLQRDANLYLYEYDPSKGKNGKLGSLLANSRVKGNKPDTISEFLPSGDYAVQVRPQGKAKTDYRLELDAGVNEDDIPTRELAEDLGELVPTPTNRKNNVGLLKDNRFRDQEDWFKFTLSEEKNVDLTVDEFRVNAANVEIYDSEGNRLYRSRNKGRAPELTNETFDAGEYYVRVVARGSGNTDYRLSLSAEVPIKPYDVFDLGDMSSKTDSNNDRVGQERSGSRNEFDVYNFSVGALTDVNVTLDQIQQNLNLELYQGTFDPEDRRARPVSRSTESGRTEEVIGEVLDSGDYHLRVIPVGNAETSYRLGIETEPAGGGDETEEVGSLSSLSEYKNRDRIGFTQSGTRNGNDFYNFSLDSQSNFTLTLDEIKRDANVMVLDSEGNMVLSGFNPSNAPEFVNGTLEAGDYTVQVFPVGSSKTNYFLKMNADPITGGGGSDDGGSDDGGDVDPITGEDPDGTPATAIDLGSDPLTQSGKVGFTEGGVEDASDYYKFTVAATDDVQIALDGLSQNADLTLLASDGATVVSASSNSDNNSEFISATLDAGDYYLRVDAVGSAQTDYTVQFL